MLYVTYMIASVVSAFLSIMQIAMLIRAILSWFPRAADSAFGNLVYAVTEIVVAPIRALCERFGWFRNSPIDFSFLIAYLLLLVVQGLLGTASSLLL